MSKNFTAWYARLRRALFGVATPERVEAARQCAELVRWLEAQLAHERAETERQRAEVTHARTDAEREREEVERQRGEVARERDETMREREEIARLREENRAMLNSLLGTAGVPPVETPRAAPQGISPIRRRSWPQIATAREIEAARKQQIQEQR